MRNLNIAVQNSTMSNQEFINELIIRLDKLESMVAVTSADDFLDFDEKIIRNYFDTVEGIVCELSEMCRHYKTKPKSLVFYRA